MRVTAENADIRARFVKNVLARGNYANEAAVMADLNRHTQRLTYYATVNDSATNYGFYRLDAIGRTFNRILEHLLNKTFITQESLPAHGSSGFCTPRAKPSSAKRR